MSMHPMYVLTVIYSLLMFFIFVSLLFFSLRLKKEEKKILKKIEKQEQDFEKAIAEYVKNSKSK